MTYVKLSSEDWDEVIAVLEAQRHDLRAKIVQQTAAAHWDDFTWALVELREDEIGIKQVDKVFETLVDLHQQKRQIIAVVPIVEADINPNKGSRTVRVAIYHRAPDVKPDIHTAKAMELFGVTHLADVTSDQREYAKAYNFAEAYHRPKSEILAMLGVKVKDEDNCDCEQGTDCHKCGKTLYPSTKESWLEEREAVIAERDELRDKLKSKVAQAHREGGAHVVDRAVHDQVVTDRNLLATKLNDVREAWDDWHPRYGEPSDALKKAIGHLRVIPNSERQVSGDTYDEMHQDRNKMCDLLGKVVEFHFGRPSDLQWDLLVKRIRVAIGQLEDEEAEEEPAPSPDWKQMVLHGVLIGYKREEYSWFAGRDGEDWFVYQPVKDGDRVYATYTDHGSNEKKKRKFRNAFEATRWIEENFTVVQ